MCGGRNLWGGHNDKPILVRICVAKMTMAIKNYTGSGRFLTYVATVSYGLGGSLLLVQQLFYAGGCSVFEMRDYPIYAPRRRRQFLQA